ncbi:MAG: DUF362 domain-containing protein [Chloroflexi bacterium]|nr:DUF362 domain-containing protein [Chloroflexota bacterium]
MPRSVVSLLRPGPRPDYATLLAAVRRALELAGGLEVAPGARVLVKPNLVAVPPTPTSGACTSAAVCRALCDIIAERGGRPFIAESSARGIDTEQVMAFMGYSALRDEGYEVLDLKRCERARVSVPEGRVLEAITTWRPVVEADAIISVPVLKTHDQTDTSLSLKNLKGLVIDADKRRIHQVGVFEGVCDLARLFRPAFALVDGLIGQEGLGPVFGLPVEMGLLVAGRDLLAVDAVASRVMGFEPAQIRLLALAAERGIGVLDEGAIEVRGERVADVARRFLRMEEDTRIAIEGIEIVHAEGSCTGCRNGVLSSLFDMIQAGTISAARGMTLVTGGALPPAGTAPDLLVPVGICCPPELCVHPRYVPGCPPNNADIVKAIVG